MSSRMFKFWFLAALLLVVNLSGSSHSSHKKKSRLRQDDERTEAKKQIILMSLPSEEEADYVNDLENIANLMKEMDNKTQGLDYLVIVLDNTGWKYFENYTFKNAHVINMSTPSMDLWTRDVTAVMPKAQVNFTYYPQYITVERAEEDKRGFNRFAELVGLPKLKQSDIVIEGGNIVENGVDAAITTGRIYEDNPDYTHSDLLKALGKAINRTVVAVTDPGQEDTTGHSDGLMSFVEKNTLLLALFDQPGDKEYYELMKREILKKFPKLKIVPLPCYVKKVKVGGFASAEGSYANTLVTNRAVYVPLYQRANANHNALEVFKNNTKKTVVPIYKTTHIPSYGGSLRCVTTQIDQYSPVGRRVLKYIKDNGL